MDSPERLLGTVVDNRYRLSEFVGNGSYGSVFAAEEVTLGRVISRVAVKLITPESEDHRQLIMNEIVGLARYHHDHVIAYRSSGQIAYGELSGCLFLVTELGDTTLSKLIKSGERLSEEELRELVRGIASALAHLHQQGAIHGDVKPANIIRVKGRWKLGDLGLLRSTNRKQAGPLHGSLTYLAPEMLRHEFAPANDIYALGVTLLYYFTGRYAHSGDSREAFIENLRTLKPNIPNSLREPWHSLIDQCLQRIPSHRLNAREIESGLKGGQTPFAIFKAHPPTAVVVVSPEGDGQFQSIQEAILAVGPGAEIVVKSGKYRETLRIDKPVRIVGEGPPENIVVSTRDARCLELLTDEEVYIRGLTFRTRPGPEQIECYAIDFSCGTATLEDCFIRSLAMPCVAIHETASPTLRFCTLHGSRDAGLFLFDGGTVLMENCRIAGNGRSGVTVSDGGKARFDHCDIQSNQSSGVYLFQSGEAIFEECRIVNNAKAGAVIGPGGKGDFHRCWIKENAGEGVVVQDGAIASVTDCDVSANTKGPWRIAPGATLTQRGNTD